MRGRLLDLSFDAICQRMHYSLLFAVTFSTISRHVLISTPLFVLVCFYSHDLPLLVYEKLPDESPSFCFARPVAWEILAIVRRERQPPDF